MVDLDDMSLQGSTLAPSVRDAVLVQVFFRQASLFQGSRAAYGLRGIVHQIGSHVLSSGIGNLPVVMKLIKRERQRLADCMKAG